MPSTFRFAPYRFLPVVFQTACCVLIFMMPSSGGRAKEFTYETMKVASQQTGLIEQQLVSRYQEKNSTSVQQPNDLQMAEPGS